MSGHRFLYDDHDMKQLVHYVEDVAEIRTELITFPQLSKGQ